MASDGLGRSILSSRMTLPNLTAKQERALLALMGERTLDDAAKSARVGQRTLRRWLQQPTFRAAFLELRREVLGAATARLQAVACDAVDALHSVVLDRQAPPAARVSAARTVLDQANRAVEIEDLSVRVAQLEERSEANSQ